MLNFFRMLSDEEAKDRMEDADADEDGKVTWEEVVQDSYGDDLEELALEDKVLQNERITYDAADFDKDGSLNEVEFRAFTHPEEDPRLTELVLKQAFDDHDRDQDSFISFQEYLIDRANKEDKEFLVVEKEKFDHEYDKNSDGKLDIHEVRGWLIPSNE